VNFSVSPASCLFSLCSEFRADEYYPIAETAEIAQTSAWSDLVKFRMAIGKIVANCKPDPESPAVSSVNGVG